MHSYGELSGGANGGSLTWVGTKRRIRIMVSSGAGFIPMDEGAWPLH